MDVVEELMKAMKSLLKKQQKKPHKSTECGIQSQRVLWEPEAQPYTPSLKTGMAHIRNIRAMKAHWIPAMGMQGGVPVRVQEDAWRSDPNPVYLRHPCIFHWDQGGQGPLSRPQSLDWLSESMCWKEDIFNHIYAEDVKLSFINYAALCDHSYKNNHTETKMKRKEAKFSWELSLSITIFSFCWFFYHFFNFL